MCKLIMTWEDGLVTEDKHTHEKEARRIGATAFQDGECERYDGFKGKVNKVEIKPE